MRKGSVLIISSTLAACSSFLSAVLLDVEDCEDAVLLLPDVNLSDLGTERGQLLNL